MCIQLLDLSSSNLCFHSSKEEMCMVAEAKSLRLCAACTYAECLCVFVWHQSNMQARVGFWAADRAHLLQADADVCHGTRAVDALLRWPRGAAALEVDGPYHFLTDTVTGARSCLTGATVLRRAGLRVISVPVTGLSVSHIESNVLMQQLAQQLRDAGVPLVADMCKVKLPDIRTPGNEQSADQVQRSIAAFWQQSWQRAQAATAVQARAVAILQGTGEQSASGRRSGAAPQASS